MTARIRTALLFAACALGLAADWPVFRGDAAMTGTAAAKLPDQLDEVWEFACQGDIRSAPAIIGDTVYVASMDRHLYALDLATGKQKWKVMLGSMEAGPAVKNGRVYVGDLEGKLHAVDAATGKALWAFETMGEIHASANFAGDDILIGSHDSTLYRVTPAGKKAWEYKIDGPINGAAAVTGDRTFVAGCDSLLHVVDTNTGKAVGTVDIGGQPAATAAVAGDFAYVGTVSGNQVLAVNWKTVKKGWEFAAKRRQQPFYSSAAVTDKLVVVGSRDRNIYALDRSTGAEIWSVATEGNVDASPVVVGSRVYVGSMASSGDFYALDLATGTIKQQLALGSSVTGSAAVGADCLVVGTEKGRVVKLGVKKP